MGWLNSTNVGDCESVISSKKEGVLVKPESNEALAEALLSYMNNLDLMIKVSENLQNKVLTSFSESSSIKLLIKIYKKHKK